MKILILTWEFPPYITGGLGIAVFGMAQSLGIAGIDVTVAAPVADESMRLPNGRVVSVPNKKSISDSDKKVNSSASIYALGLSILGVPAEGNPVYQYMINVVAQFSEDYFDVVHAHDWMTIPAAIALRNRYGWPFVFHVHSTEFDRSREGVHQQIVDIEQLGFEHADSVIAVSNYTKRVIMENYYVDPEKVAVVHNALGDGWLEKTVSVPKYAGRSPIVVFLGRITMQKGPDYFLSVAKRVLEVAPNARFVIAGRGDMEGKLIERAIAEGIKPSIIFTGFLDEEEVSQLFRQAAVYVMPSVSEPFGLTVLEAMASGTPVIVSDNAGVTEVAKHVIKVAFWDVDQIASKVIAILKYPGTLGKELQENTLREIKSFHWSNHAKKMIKKYWEVLNKPIVHLANE